MRPVALSLTAGKRLTGELQLSQGLASWPVLKNNLKQQVDPTNFFWLNANIAHTSKR